MYGLRFFLPAIYKFWEDTEKFTVQSANLFQEFAPPTIATNMIHS